MQKVSRLKFNAPLGNMPVLQYVQPSQLLIDESYQRSLQLGQSQSLIRKIAQHWNWDLCQPLVVSRREDGGLFVIDGQHRLAAARLREDITQLPAVVLTYGSAADEAANFVHLNQQRRPLGKVELFRAAVASGETEAVAISDLITEAGLALAPHSNSTAWKPGQIANLSGIEETYRRFGPDITGTALSVMRTAFAGQVIKYAGSLWPGVAALTADAAKGSKVSSDAFEALVLLVGSKSQADWRVLLFKERGVAIGVGNRECMVRVMRRARDGETHSPATASTAAAGPLWCEQCDRKVSLREAMLCKSAFCKVRPKVAA